MTVSNEDREAAAAISAKAVAEAIYVAAVAIQGAAYGKAALEKAGRVVDALISHGWGPRPTVSAKELHDLKPPKVIRYLREHRIEVTYE